MRHFFLLTLLLLPLVAHAGNAEVRDLALERGCPPKKIEVYSQKIGGNAEVIYRVECNLPKMLNEQAEGANAILIRCMYDLCTYLRLDLGSKQ